MRGDQIVVGDVDEQVLEQEALERGEGAGGVDALARLRRQGADGDHDASLVTVGVHVGCETLDLFDTHGVLHHELYPDTSAFWFGIRVGGCGRRGVFLHHQFGGTGGKGELGAAVCHILVSTLRLLMSSIATCVRVEARSWMDGSAGGSLDAAVVVRVVHLELVERNIDLFIGEFVTLSKTVVSEELRSALMYMPDGARGFVARRRIQVEARLVDDGE